jgi:hypothetical protein
MVDVWIVETVSDGSEWEELAELITSGNLAVAPSPQRYRKQLKSP